ncbi:unnamed protein product, partial [Diplocarpon coronariae]
RPKPPIPKLPTRPATPMRTFRRTKPARKLQHTFSRRPRHSRASATLPSRMEI